MVVPPYRRERSEFDRPVFFEQDDCLFDRYYLKSTISMLRAVSATATAVRTQFRLPLPNVGRCAGTMLSSRLVHSPAPR
jgi:hypothetical protein